MKSRFPLLCLLYLALYAFQLAITLEVLAAPVAKRIEKRVGTNHRRPTRSWKARSISRRWLAVAPGATVGARARTVVVASNASRAKMNSLVSGLRTHNVAVGAKQYQRLELPGAGRTSRIGYPELPLIKRQIHVPRGQRLVVNHISSKCTVYPGYTVYPAQRPLEDAPAGKNKRPRPNQVGFLMAQASYQRAGWFPRTTVRVVGTAIVRGQAVATVEIYPVQYDACAKKIRVHRELTYDLAFVGLRDEANIARAATRCSPQFKRLLGKTVINFRSLSAVSQTMRQESVAAQARAVQGCDYLIICRDYFYPNLEALVEHKRLRGLSVRRVKLSEIGNNPSADVIRTFVKEYYENRQPAPTYLLLVGDASSIPPHYVSEHPSYYEGGRNTGTDLYYGCVDRDDDVPDLFVGRWPVKSRTQVTNLVNKTIAFERAIDADAPWTRKILLAAFFEDLDPVDGRSERWFVECTERLKAYYDELRSEGGKAFRTQRVYAAPDGSPRQKRYEDGRPLPRGIHFTGRPTDSLINRLNQNVGFVFHRDHGDSRNVPYGEGEGWMEPRFQRVHTRRLENDHPAVYFSINCRTGWFDGETDEDIGTAHGNCLAEALLKRSAPHGAAAVVAASRISFSEMNNWLTYGI